MDRQTLRLHHLGVSLWLDSITRAMVADGTLQHLIDDLSVTGLTSNPTIFARDIDGSSGYDEEIQAAADDVDDEELFYRLAVEDLGRAAELFRPIHQRSNGIDGWVSLEISPLLAFDAPASFSAARRLHHLAACPNLLIKIPGTPESLPAIEEAIFAGIPVNVTLLFSAGQYQAAADAYLRGIERRIDAGLNPDVRSVASIFVSRWDKATMSEVGPDLRDRIGIAVAGTVYQAYRELLDSDRMRTVMSFGAQPQRLLWASTGTKDPGASDILYVRDLVAPYTINTMPQKTLLAFADHGVIGTILPPDGGDADGVIASLTRRGIDHDALADRLQREGAAAFSESWTHLLATIDAKRHATSRSESRVA